MPIHFELDAKRPLLTITANLSPNSNEFIAMADGANDWLSGLDHPVYYIINLADTRLSLGDIMEGALRAARGPRAPLHHPNIIETLVVTTDPLIVMAGRSIDSVIFGRLQIKMFEKLDEALGYIDQKGVASAELSR